MRNLSFLVILIGLITYVYFFEEKENIAQQEQKQMQLQLFDLKALGEMKGMTHSNLSMIKKSGKFIVGKDFLASEKQINLFFEQLTSLKVMRKLTDQEINEIPENLLKREQPIVMTVNFENGQLVFELGKKLEIDTTFYMKLTNTQKNITQWLVVKFENAYTHQMGKSSYRTDAPYKQVEAILSLNDSFFKERAPFINVNAPKSIIIKSFRNRPYNIDLLNKKVTPAPPRGIDIEVSRIENYLKLLYRIEGKEIFKVFKSQELLGELLFDGKTKISFYRSINEKKGFFLVHNKFAYIIGADVFRALFPPHQEFWRKKIEIGDNYEVYKGHNKILSASMSSRNIWTKILSSQAHHISQSDGKAFDPDYTIKSVGRQFYVRQDESGVAILDPSLDVIFHFLEKIK